jgi:hypothetical protein
MRKHRRQGQRHERDIIGNARLSPARREAGRASINLRVAAREKGRTIVRVYGIAKGARVPGRDPGQRHMRPASAAGSAVGRVRSAAMPRPMPAAGPQPEVPGKPPGKFKVTARLIAEA